MEVVIGITDIRKEVTYSVDFNDVDFRIELMQDGIHCHIWLESPEQRYDLPLDGIGQLMPLVRLVKHLFPNRTETAKEPLSHPGVGYGREHRCRVSAPRLVKVFAFDAIEQLLL